MFDISGGKLLLVVACLGWSLEILGEMMIANVESSQNMTVSRSFSVQALYFLQRASLLLIIFSVISGFLATDLDGSPDLVLQMSWIAQTVALVHPGTSIWSCFAILNG